MLVLRGVNEQRVQDHQDALAVAWHTANLTRAKRMPSLRRYLGIETPAPTEEEMTDLAADIDEAMRGG